MTDTTINARHTKGATVHGLLGAADVAARDLLLDVRGDDAPALLRTWGDVVDSATQVWKALPGRSGDAMMTRLAGMTRGLDRSRAGSGWPRAGAGDDRLIRISQTFLRATEAIHADSDGVGPDTHGSHGDNARAHVLHTLYVTAHAMTVAVREHVREAGRRTNGVAQTVNLAVVGRAVLGRLAAFEQLVGADLDVRADVTSPTVAAATPGDRLRTALIRWDIQAHRTLATTPTPAAMVMITRVQASLATTSHVVLGAAAVTGPVDRDTFSHRLAPALDRTHNAWAHLAGRWAELTSPGTSAADRGLTSAAAGLRAAMLDVVADGPAAAGPRVMAMRVDLAAVSRDLHQALAAAVDVAYDARDVADRHPDLSGRAKVMSRRANDDAEISGPSIEGVWVPIRDVHANRIVPIPAPARAGLVAATDEAIENASLALSTAAGLDRPAATRTGKHSDRLVSCGVSVLAPGL